MAVMAPREKWTDERLDDLNNKVDDGFARLEKKTDEGLARVDGDLKVLRADMNRGFDKVDGGFEKIDARFDKVDARFERVDGRLENLEHRIDKKFERVQYLMFGGIITIVAAILGSNAF